MPESHTSNRWLPLIGGTMFNLVLGSFYGWSVFVLPLEQEFGWVREQTSTTFSIGTLTMAVMFLISGRLHATVGFRTLATIGGVLFSLGFFLASFTTSLTVLYLAYGLIAGAGNGIGYSVGIPVVSKWFPDKRGLALGILVGGYGAGSGVLGPIAGELLIPSVGWEATFRIYGVLFLIISMIGAWLLKPPPDGYTPPGWDPSQLKTAVARSSREIAPAEMLRGSSFYFLFLAYFFGSVAGLGLISQLVPFGTEAGITSVALIGLVVGAVGNTAGRVLSGAMSDTLGRLNVLRLMVVISAFAMPLLYLLGSNVLFFVVGVFVVYYCYGALLAVFAATSADFYGTKHLGVNYGLLFLAWGLAAVVGARLAGTVFDAFGNYQWAFVGAAALSILSLLCLYAARNPTAEARA
ncbi:MAG: OFA family MFS transporter [Acidobacteriota bacterium]|nr:OFA family MFS transporter [Acidobacteriota bacterium]